MSFDPSDYSDCAVAFKFDEGTGTTATDASGHGNDATVNEHSSSIWVPGKFGNALSFDGTGGEQAESAFSISPNIDVTICFWVYQVSGSIQDSSAFGTQTVDITNRCQCHAPWSDGTLYWDYGNIATGGRISTSFSGYADAWTHVALIGSPSYRAIYLNGSKITDSTSSGAPSITLSGLLIGRFNSYWQRAAMDEFRIYTRQLNASDIYDLYAWNGSGPSGLPYANDALLL